MAIKKTSKSLKPVRKTASKTSKRQTKRPATIAESQLNAAPMKVGFSSQSIAQATAIEELTVEELSAEEQLINLGREKGYVTYEDILGLFPDAEKNMDQLEELFAALSDASVAVVASEDEAADQAVDDDDDDEDEYNERSNESLIEAIEADDTVGLYLKEIGRVALLTAPQEVDLAQRMERGREAREQIPDRRSH